MKLLDYDYDEGKYVVTIETTHKELFSVASAIEFANHALINDFEKSVMKQLHDLVLEIISFG